MIIGIGTDIARVARFELAMDRHGERLAARLLGAHERARLAEHGQPAAFLAKRFAAKERPEIDVSVQLAADVAETFVARGGEDARQHAGESNV